MTKNVKSANGVNSSNTRTRKSEKVNSAKISTDVLTGVISAPAGAGLSDGSIIETSAPVTVGSSDVCKGGKGRSNTMDQINASIVTAAKESEEEENRKEETLYNKIMSHFSAPAFDVNKYAAEMIANGLPFTEIKNAVADGKKEWENNHPAPKCDVSRVLSVCSDNYAKEFVSLIGIHPTNITPSAVRVFSRPAGVLLSRPVESDASASAIVRAVLSWRWYVKDCDETKKREFARKSNYYDGLRAAARNGIDLGLDDDRIISDFTIRLRAARAEMDGDTLRIKTQFIKYRKQLDDAINKVVSLCPSVAVARLGSSDDVFVLPENITKEQKAVCGVEFAKIRNIRRNITALNAALWGVKVVL